MANPAKKQPKLAGVVGIFDDPASLIEAVKKVRDQNYESFDAFTPYPIHGLPQAQGLPPSKLPFVTMTFGLVGLMCAALLQGWTSVLDWPVNIGGKPFWSWPAFVPIFFELTVLFSGLATVGGMFALNGLPNTKKRSFDNNITRDKFAIMIDAPKVPTAEMMADMDDDELARHRKRLAKYNPFEEGEAKRLLESLGAKDVRSVESRGWFE